MLTMYKRLLLFCLFLTGYAFSLVGQNESPGANSEAGSYFDKARKLDQEDDFSAALYYYQMALKESEIAGDSNTMYRALFQIGVIHAKNENSERAADYFNRTLAIVSELDELQAISDCHTALGNVNITTKQFNKALYHFDQALEITQALKDSSKTALCLNNLGVLYNTLGVVEKAKYYYEQVLAYDEGTGNTANIIIGLVNVGSCYLKLQENKKAIEYMTRALHLSDSIDSPNLRQQVYYGLAQAYESDQDYERSLQYYKLHTAIRDSLFNLSSTDKIAELESKYQSEKKQKEIIKLTADNQKSQLLLQKTESELQSSKFLLWSGAVVLFLILLFGYIAFRQYQAKEKINRDLVARNEEISVQKKHIESNLAYTQKLQDAMKADLHRYMQLALSKQMNPHFIFNSLNSIQSYILRNDKLSANIYLAKFSDLMRKVLENSRREFVTVSEEVSTSKLYIELEQKRFENKFEFQLTVDEELNTNYFLIPPLILQPYLENAIWHGLMHKTGAGLLALAIQKKGGQIIFRISDNGIGRAAAAKLKAVQSKQHESLGTKITAHRLDMMNSLNRTDISVAYMDLEDDQGLPAGTTVQITIPTLDAFDYDRAGAISKQI
jgi:tetratricopeptide (TPR) repeat protein